MQCPEAALELGDDVLGVAALARVADDLLSGHVVVDAEVLSDDDEAVLPLAQTDVLVPVVADELLL